MQSPWTERGWFGLYKQCSTHRPAPSTQPRPSLLHTLSTSKPRSAQADDVERPRNAMNIARPPGIQELVINSPPKPGFSPLSRFSIQNSSRLCHLPAFCRHGTLSCSLGAIQQSRTVWREKQHCEASQDSRAPSIRSVHVTPCPEGPTRPGDVKRCYQPHGEAQMRGTLLQAGLLLLGKWLCAQGQPWPAAHQHSRANTGCRATNQATPQPQEKKQEKNQPHR